MQRSVAIVLSLLLLGVLAPAQGRGLDPEQVARLRTVSEVTASPDGRRAVYTVVEPRGFDEAPGGARLSLWAAPEGPGETPRRLLREGTSPRGVAFSPDGNWLTFLDRREGDEHTEVYALPLDGGEARRLTRTPHGVSSYAWRPDGEAIAFTATDPPPPARARARAKGFRPIVHDEDFDHVSLWMWDRKSGESLKITEGVTVFDLAWSPDSARLALAIAPRNLVDDSYMLKRLHVWERETGELKPLVRNPGKLGAFAWSPEGRRLAYVSAADRRDPHAGMLYVIGLGETTPKALTEGFLGMVETVSWRDADTLLCAVAVGVKSFVSRIDVASGSMAHLAGGAGIAFGAFAPIGDDEVLVAGSTPKHPAELFRLSLADGARLRLTDSNPWLGEVALGDQEIFRFRARDDLEIEGLLIKPVGYEKGRRYPLVIVVHGGPEAHFSDGWLTRYSEWGQMLAARGYVAWYPNYRASTGYGVEFVKADHGDPMGGEFRDHLDAIAALDERGLIDPKRVGIGGGSYGGYTAAWAATAGSEHFAAAVSFVPFTDIRTKWLTSDIPIEFHRVHYEEKWPHEQREFLASRSPLSFAERCRTPLLLAGGDADPRVHPSQPFMLYRAVQVATETPVRYVKYRDEGHGNRIDRNRYDYCLRALRWFDHYLGEGGRRDRPLPPVDLDYPGYLD